MALCNARDEYTSVCVNAFALMDMKDTNYIKSTTEEILAILYGIASLLAFNGGHFIIGSCLLGKALMDILSSLLFAFRVLSNKEEL